VKPPRFIRPGFIYFSDDGDLVALRFDNWKVVFLEQRVVGTLRVWAEPFVVLRLPKLYNLRTDPFERADITSNTYDDWVIDRGGYMFLVAQVIVGQFRHTSDTMQSRRTWSTLGAAALPRTTCFGART
jgi:hypothetical protein